LTSSLDVFVLRVAGVEGGFRSFEAGGREDGGDGGGLVADVTGTRLDGDTEGEKKK